MGKWSRTTLKAGLPTESAVYVVIRNDGVPARCVLYVGQTKNLKTRFCMHHMQFRQRHPSAIIAFSIRHRLNERLNLEMRLIQRLNPIGNTVRNRNQKVAA